ncbi:MAG: DEAD/DEAH box helicase [Gemmatimonadaceae bacterium]
MTPHQRFTNVDPVIARATLAAGTLNAADGRFAVTGSVHLQPHQVSAALRLELAIREFGGALLADPVGTGKTYVALALAERARAVTVVAPAVLRDMWRAAAAMANCRIRFLSFEALGRGHCPTEKCDFLIVDEAHHARNPRTKRFRMLARLACGTDVLLLTATPIHNQRRDVVALLSLFLGHRSATMSAPELGRCVIRRETSLTGMPRTEPLVWLGIDGDSRVPALLLSLPPPVSPSDGGDGGSLVIHSLIRQWASSTAALCGGLRRRIVRGEALIAALSDGTWPSKTELMSWIAGEDAVQLSLPGMLARASDATARLLPIVRTHVAALSEALSAARAENSADCERASHIRRIRVTHGDRRIIVFSQYADTISAMFRLVSPDGEVAALTGSGGYVAGGSISRSEILARFAPRASGAQVVRRSDAVTLLLATDLLSEGVNLQDAGVVVHLDLPWTPARIEQRLGRIARIGSTHESVVSYAIRPPREARNELRTELILRRKMHEASIIVPGFLSLDTTWATPSPTGGSAPAQVEQSRVVLEGWLREDVVRDQASKVVAAVAGSVSGFLALCHDAFGARLVGCIGDTISDEPPMIVACLNHSSGFPRDTDEAETDNALLAVGSWLAADEALSTKARYRARRSPIAASALRRIDQILRQTPRHQRAIVADLAHQARNCVTGRLGHYLEEELGRRCSTDDDGVQWLSKVVELVDQPHRARHQVDQRTVVQVMILFRESNALTFARER